MAVPDPDTQQIASQRYTRGLLLLLAVFVTAQIVAGWRYFPGFVGDHAWYLRVAQRLSQGEVLYRDVAWAYGPLPAQVLATFFRWLGPDAAWASTINAALTGLALVLTYRVLRALFAPLPAGLITAFATVAGPSVWGDLFHTHFYVYTQAIAWGSVSSLAALAASLRWQSTRRDRWMLVAGLASGLAILSKPEFGLVAAGASAAVLGAARSRLGPWIKFAALCLLVAGFGFAVQAQASGWHALWRGYSGYDQLATQGLWGARWSEWPRLAEFYGLWAAGLAVVLSRSRPRQRRLLLAGAALLAAVAMLLLLADSVVEGRRAAITALLNGGWRHVHVSLAHVAVLLIAAPWAPLLWLLIASAWLVRRQASPAWWGLWAFAVLSNLRPALTGFASGLAAGPALAVLIWAAATRWPRAQVMRRAGIGLAALAVLNVGLQAAVPDPLFNGPRAVLLTSLGVVRAPAGRAQEAAAVQAAIKAQTPDGAPLVGIGWAAQWYLLTGHPNSTAFDVLFPGMGGSGPERAPLEAALAATPPQVIVLSARLPVDVQMERAGLELWWRLVAARYRPFSVLADEWMLLISTQSVSLGISQEPFHEPPSCASPFLLVGVDSPGSECVTRSCCAGHPRANSALASLR